MTTNEMHRYQFNRTLSAWEAMQLERAIEPNAATWSSNSATAAIAYAEDNERIVRQMTDVRVSGVCV